MIASIGAARTARVPHKGLLFGYFLIRNYKEFSYDFLCLLVTFWLIFCSIMAPFCIFVTASFSDRFIDRFVDGFWAAFGIIFNDFFIFHPCPTRFVYFVKMLFLHWFYKGFRAFSPSDVHVCLVIVVFFVM